MGKSAGETKTTSTTGLPATQQPYYDTLLKEATSLYGGGGPQYYPGQTYSGFTPEDVEAHSSLINSARTATPFMNNQVLPSLQQSLQANQPGALNPQLEQAIGAATRPVWKGLTEQALPQIRSGAVGAGAMGGSRQGIAEGLAIGEATKQAQDASTQMAFNAWNQGQQTALSAQSLTPSIMDAMAQPADWWSAVGTQQRDMADKGISENIARYNWEQTLPFSNLSQYASMITLPQGGTSTSQVAATPASGTAQTLGTILAGISQVPGLIDIFRKIIGGG